MQSGLRLQLVRDPLHRPAEAVTHARSRCPTKLPAGDGEVRAPKPRVVLWQVDELDGGPGRRKLPDVVSELEDGDGKAVSLEKLAGKDVVLYFYPRDDTPGCTKEACGFRDLTPQFEAVGAVILGVSTDPMESHTKFQAKHKLPFELLWLALEHWQPELAPPVAAAAETTTSAAPGTRPICSSRRPSRAKRSFVSILSPF